MIKHTRFLLSGLCVLASLALTGFVKPDHVDALNPYKLSVGKPLLECNQSLSSKIPSTKIVTQFMIERHRFEQSRCLSSYKEQTEQSAEHNPSAEIVPYIVKKGDTLYQIARKFNLTVDQISRNNTLSNPNLLQIGQKLYIPSEINIDLPIEVQNIEQTIVSTLTAYTAGKESTGKSPGHPQYGITYSGKRATEGRTIAVDPSVIPIGTQVYIEGIGYRTAEDIGSAIKGNRIDLFIEDLDEALQFGVQKDLVVHILGEDNEK